MISRTVLATLMLSAAFVAGSWGCGQTKEEAAVERLMNTVPPAKIRMVNLSSEPITMVSQNWTLESDLQPGQSCNFRMLPSGQKEVVFKSGDRVIETISREFGPKKPYTVLIADAGNGIGVHLIDGEKLAPTASTNLSTYYVGLDGDASRVPITLTGAGQSYTVGPGTGDIKLAAGDYSLSGDGVTDTHEFSVEARGMYSLYIVDAANGKRFAYLIQNNPSDEPSLGGQPQRMSRP